MNTKLNTLFNNLALLCILAALLGAAACTMPFKIVPNVPEEGPPPGEELLPPEGEEDFHPEEEPFPEGGEEPHDGEEPSDEVWIEFEAERTNVEPGECTMLFWHVEGGGFGAYLNGEPVERSGEREVCLDETMIFVLGVDMGEEMEGREIEIVVDGMPGEEPPPEEPPPAGGSSGGGCPGAPVISSFTASPSAIKAGEKSRLEWGPVTNGNTSELVGLVEIDHGIGGVGSPGSSWASPTTTTTYTLTATGCGGTATKQVTVTVGGGSSGGSGGAFTTDIAVTDIYPGNQPHGQFHVRITNHGPGTLNQVPVTVVCQGSETDLNTKNTTGGIDQFDIKLSMNPGETQSYPTGITLDFNTFSYILECEVQPGFNDPDPGNNKYGEGFNGSKYIGP